VPPTYRRLIEKRTIRAVAIADSDTATVPLTVVVALDVAHQELDYVTRKLGGLSEIAWLATTTGQFDIVALAKFDSMEELNEFIRGKLSTMEGIKDSETFVCLHIEKGKHLLTID